MAEGGRSQSMIAPHKDEPIRGSENARTRSERTLVSFESFESTTMLPDCRGWLMETESRKQFWCVAASKMLGLFSMPEADEPIKVLTLTDFQVETFVNDVDMSINGADNLVSSEKHVSSIAALKPRKQEYVIVLKPLSKGAKQHLFLVPSEGEHLLWRKALQASCPSKVPSFSRREKMLKQKKISFEEPCRTDSGLGDDLEPPLDHRKSESGDPKIPEPTSFINGAVDFDSRSDQARSRGSSFVSSVATIDDLADSNSTSDSASVGNNSTVNLSEFDFPDAETGSCGRQSLNDSVFLGMSQELDLNQWSDSKDADCFTSDGDSLPNSPHPRQTSSSMSSAGDITEGPHRPASDQTKTMISKVSKLVHRVAQMRRPRSNSSLTLGQIPDSKMSGPMRKKGKLRWYVLSGTCLYCFKSNSKDEEAEVIYDLSSYTVALATEEKEDKRSICILKLTHSSGKKVLFTINNMETAQLWFNYTQDAIRESSTSKSRSDSQRSTSSNPESQSLGRNRLSRQSFEDSYGFFERQSSLRCVKDALQNAVSESPKIKKQDSSSGSSGGSDEKQEGGLQSDFESVTPPTTHWASSEDLSMEFTEKKSHPAIRFIMKHSSKSPLLGKRSLRQMPIPASDIVDPTMSGLLSVYVQNKGTWKKYWTVLKDDWLYFYKRPTDTSTSDIIDLPSFTIQRERRMAESAPLSQTRFIFSITDEDGSDRAILMADTEKDTRAWMNKLKSQAKQRRSTTLDGLNLESGQSSLHLHKPDSHSKPHKWQKNQAELHKQRLLQEVLQQNQGGQQRAADSSKSALEVENPEVTKKRAEILTKYQKANDNEEEEQVRLMTLLNRRRMSAQVKKDVLERTMANRAKKRMERIGSVEEASMEDQIKILNERLQGIEAEMDAKSFQKRSRVQSLKDKEDLELQLLEQKERLSRYRQKTHSALKSTSELDATLEEMDEETLDCGDDSTDSPKRRESPSLLEDKNDETDCRDQTPVEKVSQRLSPCVQMKKTDDDSQTEKSPNTRRKRLLPSLPDKADPKLNTAGGKGDIPGRSSHQQGKLNRTGEKSPSVNHKMLSEVDYLRQRSVSDVLERKTPSPIHSRKISVEAQLLPDTNGVTTSKLKATHRSDSVPHLPQASQEVSKGVRTMKHSASSSDMSLAIKKSPGLRRAKEYPSAGAQSSPKPRRKISVPIKMPSMDNFFHSSSLKGNKDKARKISSTSLSNIARGTYKVMPQNGDARSLSSSSSSIHLSTPSSSGSPDINGNMHPRRKGHGGPVEEIDPEVLRDIEEFEMMARKALRDAGWTFRL